MSVQENFHILTLYSNTIHKTCQRKTTNQWLNYPRNATARHWILFPPPRMLMLREMGEYACGNDTAIFEIGLEHLALIPPSEVAEKEYRSHSIRGNSGL